MDFFNDIFHNLALLEFYFLNIIYILLYIDFILSIFFHHSNILTRASHHWCLASNIVLVMLGLNLWLPLYKADTLALALVLAPTWRQKIRHLEHMAYSFLMNNSQTLKHDGLHIKRTDAGIDCLDRRTVCLTASNWSGWSRLWAGSFAPRFVGGCSHNSSVWVMRLWTS